MDGRRRPVAQETSRGVEFVLVLRHKRIARKRVLLARPGRSPLSPATVDKGDCDLRFGIVREQPLRGFQLGQGLRKVAVDTIETKTVCEMRFGQIGLQTQGFARLRMSTNFQLFARGPEPIK